MNKSACSVGNIQSLPSLCPGFDSRQAHCNLQTRANDRACFCRQMTKNMYIKDKTGE